MASQSIATILAFLPTGWVGIHHFYLGNRFRGIAYLLFSWTLIPILFAAVDGFLFSYKDKEAFVRKYGSDEELHQIQKEKFQEYHLRQGKFHEYEDMDRQNTNTNDTSETQQDEEEDSSGNNSDFGIDWSQIE